MSNYYRIFISAGDLSGEVHASNLIKEIKKINPLYFVSSTGGNNLKAVSDNFIEDIVNINAFGFLPIKQVFYLRKVFKKIKRHFLDNRPDKVILVDYYGFHIHVARLAKSMGISVFYYISPQVWASRSGRIKELSKVIKKMFVIFPFEEKLYKDNNVDAVFVGNPLIDKIPQKVDFQNQNFNILNPPVIGLFPGSRQSTVKRHISILFETAKILKKEINARFVMFCVSNKINFALPEYISFDGSKNFEKRVSIDFAISPSGTVCLENTLMGIPMVIVYKVSYFNYFFIRALVKIKYIGIVNILAGKSVVPEFIQFDANPKKIAQSVMEQLKLENYLPKVQELFSFRKFLGSPGVSNRVAEIILNS
ncbi:MAG: lipid-A-disaccharide synthase [Endomicrobium sp.]|jgi:lipid-A-disaccharide synthase|nr:lipid-A-disaccharide synthase [Endomicrobium sp.]